MKILAIQEGHTATAALSVDGEIVGCVSEERFLRQKNFEGYPKNSIDYLLRLTNNKIDNEESKIIKGYMTEKANSSKFGAKNFYKMNLTKG